jgi:flagellum-specific peptidoglycan hydrolase FlgJ
MSEESFIKEIAPYAQKIQKEFKILPSVVIAQACLESGYGTSLLANQGKNIFVQKVTIKESLSLFKQSNKSTMRLFKYGPNSENIQHGQKVYKILPIYM